MNKPLVLYNNLTMTKEKLSEILSTLRAGLEELLEDQLAAVYLYGSHARGEAASDSDIDVLVVLNWNFDYFDMIEQTGDLAAKLSLENDTVIALAFVTKDNYQSRQTPFLMNVRREGVSV